MQLFVYLLVFQFQVVNAQELPKAQIFVSNDAVIYSADLEFNSQIAENNIDLKNLKNKSIEVSKQKKNILVISQKSETDEKLAELKFKNKENGVADLKEIQEKVKLVEVNKAHYASIKLESFPSDDLFSGADNSQFSATSVPTSNLVSKELIHNNFAVIFDLLSFKNFQKYVCYNNKSLGFCFSKVFSVRPPPHNFS